MVPNTNGQSFLLFCGVAIIFAFRVNLSVAIIAMTDKSEPYYDVIMRYVFVKKLNFVFNIFCRHMIGIR